MNISPPDSLGNCVDEQACERGYGSIGEHVASLIRNDQARQRLKRHSLG